MDMHLEEARKAGEEIRRACENPETLVHYLSRLVARKKRKGVISDLWSYRNQLLVLLRGYSEARGPDQWAKVGRKVEGEPFYIVLPRFTSVEDRPTTKSGKPKKNAPPVKRQVLKGFMGRQVWGLEQTQPAEDYRTEEKYTPWEDDGKREYAQVFHGYKVPWYRWYSALRPDVEDQLTGHIGAAILAKLADDATELEDLLRKLRSAGPAEVAKRIDKACKAVAAYLSGKKPREIGRSQKDK